MWSSNKQRRFNRSDTEFAETFRERKGKYPCILRCLLFKCLSRFLAFELKPEFTLWA